MNTITIKEKFTKEHMLQFIKSRKMLILVIMLIGFAARLCYIGGIPCGLNQDEAFAGYNAYSLLHYGIDSSGYHNPVYLVAWGSGMNALESYLMIPFVALFGLETWVIRLPQALLGCASLVVFYLLLKKIFNERTALMGLIVLAVCPWHIMMSRWGLESNLAPAFLLFGLYFFVRGVEDNSKWFYASAVSYGLCLYSYATLWPILPVLLLLQVVYCICYKKISLKDKHFWLAVVVLGVMALPLMLFLLVNYGYIGEIRTWLLSVPKLTSIRFSDISLKNMPQNLQTTYQMILTQTDGNYYNAIGDFGIYYKFSNVFVALGVGVLFVGMVQNFRKKVFSAKTLVVIELVMTFAIGLLIQVNINRINAIWIWLILCIPVAIGEISDHVWKEFGKVCMVIYGICFIAFGTYYYSSQFNNNMRILFSDNLEKPIKEAVAYTKGTIYVDSDIYYPHVLFYSKMPTDEFVNTVVYRDPTAKFMSPLTYGRFVEYEFDASTLGKGTYVLSVKHSQDVIDAGYMVTGYGRYIVAIKE